MQTPEFTPSTGAAPGAPDRARTFDNTARSLDFERTSNNKVPSLVFANSPGSPDRRDGQQLQRQSSLGQRRNASASGRVGAQSRALPPMAPCTSPGSPEVCGNSRIATVLSFEAHGNGNKAMPVRNDGLFGARSSVYRDLPGVMCMQSVYVCIFAIVLMSRHCY